MNDYRQILKPGINPPKKPDLQADKSEKTEKEALKEEIDKKVNKL